MFFDSHCHLTDERLLGALPEVLQRARDQQVSGILSISVDLLDAEAVCRLADGQTVWATAGVHPQAALTWTAESEHHLRDLLHSSAVCAVGEIGLDYLYDDTHAEYPGATRERQEEVMEAQLHIAAELNLPVVIHNRHADLRLLEIMRSWRNRLTAGGVFHCFGSPPEVARQVLDLDFHLGFTGIVTFKNAAEIREVVKLCPPQRMLIETDAPYLAPVPHRGKTNEPSFVPLVAATIAELKQLPVQDVAQITTDNARTLFGLNPIKRSGQA